MTTKHTTSDQTDPHQALVQPPVLETSGTPQAPEVPAPTEDFVRIAAFATPAEAHVLRGLLVSAGLSAVVTDANSGQGNPWVTQSTHAVGVLVPESQEAAARETMAAFESGAYTLADDTAPAPSPAKAQPALIFNPDRAALLSFVLSPIFGVLVLMANARAVGWTSSGFSRWMWLLVTTTATATGVFLLNGIAPGWLVGFRANLVFVGGLTVLWYFFSAQAQTRQIIEAYGPHYRRRSLLVPAIGTALAWLVLGMLLTHWPD